MNTPSLKKNTIYNIIKTFSSIVFPVITFPYISRVLQVKNIGKINFGLSIVSYFALLASLGVSVYAIRECSKYRDDRSELSKIASEIFSISVITTIVSYILLIILLFSYNRIADYRHLIIIQSLSILFTTLGTDWINTAMEDFQYITLRTIAFQLISLVLMFLFIHSPNDYIKYAVISVVASSGANILNMIYRNRYCNIRFTIKLNFRKHILPIITLFAMLMAQTIFNNSDMNMLGVMKGDFEVGIYSTAHKISNVISQIVSSILWVVIPRTSYYFSQNNFTEINRLLRKILAFNITLGFPLAIGAIMLSKDIIYIIAGEQYTKASVVLSILMIAFLISLFGGSFLGNVILLSTNHEKYYMIVCVICAFINVILNYIFIQEFSYVGAAITTTLCSLLILIMLLFKVDKNIKIKSIIQLFISPVIGCIFVVIICYLCYNISNLYCRVGCATIVSVACYFVVQLVTKNTMCIEAIETIKHKFLVMTKM